MFKFQCLRVIIKETKKLTLFVNLEYLFYR